MGRGGSIDEALYLGEYAATLGRAGLIEPARRAYERALSHAPRAPRLLAGLAWAHGEIARNLVAEPRSRDHARASAMQARGLFDAANAHVADEATGRHVDAAIERVSVPESVEAALEAAFETWSTGRLTAADRALREARALEPHRAAHSLQLARLSVEQRDPVATLRHLRAARAAAPSSEEERELQERTATAFEALAAAALARGHRAGFEHAASRATAHLERLLAKDPTRVDLRARRDALRPEPDLG